MKYLSLFILLMFQISLVQAQAPADAKDIAPLLISEQIPSTQIGTMGGQSLDVLEVFKKKPSVLLFYRGGWCPYCNAHLSEVGKIEKEIIDLGYQVIAISPDNPENLNISSEKNNLGYQLYSDGSGTLVKAMGIAFLAPERYTDRLMKYSSDQNTGRLLPVPSVFIVDTEGVILFEYISPNYKQRMSSGMLLGVLKNLNNDQKD